jgi:antitoxin component HigA of HigAB toxin-antitoxin module
MTTAKVDKGYFELIKEFPLVPLRDKSHFDTSVKLMKRLAYQRSELSRGESDYLAVLADLIAHYEKRLPPLADELSPQAALVYLMEQNGLTQSDLVQFVGHKSNLSAFLSGNRGLSKLAACRIAAHFRVSPALFLPK